MKKIKFIILILGIFCFHTATAQPGCFSRIDSIEYGDAKAIKADKQGNYYVTGRSGNSSYYNGVPIVNSGNGGVYLAKFDLNHNIVWMINQESPNFTSYSNALAIDQSDNIVIGGWYYDPIIFSGDTLKTDNGGGDNAFISKFRTDGSHVWSRKLHTPGIFSGGKITSLACDTNDNIYFGGVFGGTLIFGDDTIQSIGYGDDYWGKMDSLGNVQWLKAAGSIYIETGSHVACDMQGNMYVTGSVGTNTSPSAYFDTVSNFLPYGFIAKYSTNGVFQWLVTDENEDGYFDGRAIAVSPEGRDIAVTGMIAADSVLTIIGNDSIFVTHKANGIAFTAKLDSSGNVFWINDIVKCGKCIGTSILFNGSDTIIISSRIQIGLAIVGTDTLYFDQALASSPVLVHIDAQTGNPITACYFDYDFTAYTQGEALAKSGNKILYTGTFTNIINGQEKIFIAEYSPFPTSVIETLSNTLSADIYPNPVQDILHFKNNELQNGDYKMILTNTIGQVVSKKELRVTNHSIHMQFDISGLPEGVYFLSVSSGNVREAFKVYKQ